MSAPPRPTLPPKSNSMRPPPPRPLSNRTLSAAPTLTGRISPASSLSSTTTPQSPRPGGTKRKAADVDSATVGAGEETNINVVVRCRGRSEREVRENSGVVVSTDGLKGRTVELSMGPSALSNKTYCFDKVFSPAADQAVVFGEVVAPVLEEVLGGFNCTVFAYGQTGTGKTYTMSGDITDVLPAPDEAGIIPRVLHTLFEKLEASEAENSVKCSFIELYNEELRDLLAADEGAKLKIYDDASRKSTGATLVQGVEETHIKSASRGLELLRIGSHKRQVAATKCNDLSSRSHTVFTITVHMKRISDTGEELVSTGKLNLVDLAGSENIQRSGAENKRAAEAGLINKSLLTLGRVINALVDKSSHIPYRESKLTRLLQDSLGGRTKTCIIATLSPAKSNLEETISTLDYAFRAKNIRNKPQVNQMISKKTLLREFTGEIEKLKGELIAARSRNGVYLTPESWEELTTESESRRILSEEQRDKIITMETNLRSKTEELFALTSSLNMLKRDNEAVRLVLDSTKGTLEKTEVVLQHTRQSLAEEAALRKAHQKTEENLLDVGQELLCALGLATSEVGGLRNKLRRQNDLQSQNRITWNGLRSRVTNTTTFVQDHLTKFEDHQQRLMTDVSARMQGFIRNEMSNVMESTKFLQERAAFFRKSETEVNEQTAKAHDEMNEVLEEIKTLREGVKEQVGAGLQDLSAAAQKISAGVIAELEGFHTQLHASYSSLGKDFKHAFDDLVKQIHKQQAEADELKQQLYDASCALAMANEAASVKLEAVMMEEKKQAAEDRANLIAQIATLVHTAAETREKRMDSKIDSVRSDYAESKQAHEGSKGGYIDANTAWNQKQQSLVESILRCREAIKSKIKKDWTVANEHNVSIQATTRSVHEETVRIVDAQVKQMDVQLQALDEIVSRVRAQNGRHHEAHVQSFASLTSSVGESYSTIGDHFTQSSGRTSNFETDFARQMAELTASHTPLQQNVHRPLADLHEDVLASSLTEYTVTGETPQKTQYHYPSTLPRTEDHEVLLDRLRKPPVEPHASPTRRTASSRPASPVKAMIFTDVDIVRDKTVSEPAASPIMTRAGVLMRPASANGGLRELNINVAPSGNEGDGLPKPKLVSQEQPPLKRQNIGVGPDPAEAKENRGMLGMNNRPSSKLQQRSVVEERECVMLGSNLSR